MKRKPFVRYIRLNCGEDVAQGITETFSELGYMLYRNPIEDGGVFISNIPLTEGWLQCNAWKFNIKLRRWKPEGNEELDQIF